MRFIFQKLDILSHIKWYISMILKVIKPVDFHHFGKEYKCKRHFDHRICRNINVNVTLITESASEFFLAVSVLLFIFSLELSLPLPT